MKNLLAASAIALALPASADTVAPYSDLYVFGDSLSDSGNAAVLADSFGGGFNYADYPLGQFTDGNAWATQLGLAPSLLGGTNYAYGGARAMNNGDIIPDLGAQIDAFDEDARALGASPLAAIYVGGNDFRDFASAGVPTQESTLFFVSSLVAEISAGVTELASAGFQDIVVFSIPDLGIVPELVGTAFGELVSGVVAQTNAALQGSVATLDAWLAGVQVTFFDTSPLFDEILRDNNPYGFTNLTEQCLDAGAECDPETYVFWDDIHPTEAVHEIIAAEFSDQISVVPLPAGLPLLIGGLAALGLVSRRRRSHA